MRSVAQLPVVRNLGGTSVIRRRDVSLVILLSFPTGRDSGKRATIDKCSSHSISLMVFGRLYVFQYCYEASHISNQCTCKDRKWAKRHYQRQYPSGSGNLSSDLGDHIASTGTGGGVARTGVETPAGCSDGSTLPQALIRSIMSAEFAGRACVRTFSRTDPTRMTSSRPMRRASSGVGGSGLEHNSCRAGRIH
jgi:hypothetical protein